MSHGWQPGEAVLREAEGHHFCGWRSARLDELWFTGDFQKSLLRSNAVTAAGRSLPPRLLAWACSSSPASPWWCPVWSHPGASAAPSPARLWSPDLKEPDKNPNIWEKLVKTWFYDRWMVPSSEPTCVSHAVHQKQDVLVHMSNRPRTFQRGSGALRRTSAELQLFPNKADRVGAHALACSLTVRSSAGDGSWLRASPMHRDGFASTVPASEVSHSLKTAEHLRTGLSPTFAPSRTQTERNMLECEALLSSGQQSKAQFLLHCPLTDSSSAAEGPL